MNSPLEERMRPQRLDEFDGNFVDMEFMPEQLSGHKLYIPGDNPRENEMKSFLKSRWKDKYKT